MMFWYGGHWPFWQAGLMWIGMFAFWGFLIWAIYALITRTTRKPPGAEHSDKARAILDQRLARGEISPEEYQRLRGLIGSAEQSPASSGSTR